MVGNIVKLFRIITVSIQNNDLQQGYSVKLVEVGDL